MQVCRNTTAFFGLFESLGKRMSGSLDVETQLARREANLLSVAIGFLEAHHRCKPVIWNWLAKLGVKGTKMITHS